EVSGGKGSHRKFVRTNYAGAVTISGKIGEKMPRFIKKTGSTSLRAGESMKKSDQYLKWIEWSEQDQIYIGKCPDLITGIHGEDPVRLYGELCEIVE
ncbi:MAG: hypothetical protein ACU88J_05980, partial [Gammaproteobacteria bacterium]